MCYYGAKFDNLIYVELEVTFNCDYHNVIKPLYPTIPTDRPFPYIEPLYASPK